MDPIWMYAITIVWIIMECKSKDNENDWFNRNYSISYVYPGDYVSGS